MRAWYERFPSTYADERAYWLGKGFEEADVRRGDVAFTGVITVCRGGEDGLEQHAFKLRIDYPPGYPYVAPTVEFLDPPIRRARHQSVNGAPCLFPPSAWTTTLPASELYAATERWLACHLAGHFPRELALYELPEYFGWMPFAVLASPDALGKMVDKRQGRFSVDELLGRDLGIVWSVDEQEVGKALESAIAPAREGSRHRHTGSWYRLDNEPPPMQHSKELEGVLKHNGHQVAFTKRPRGRELIALAFRDTALEEERVLVLDIGVASKKATPTVGKGWAIRAPRIYRVSPEDLFRRLEGVRDLDRLGEKRVACFGLGAIGSSVALALTREGVGSFSLSDPDTLRPGNVVRHALDLLSVGTFKAEATETAIGRINPFADTAPEVQNLAHPDVIGASIRGADLIVAAIGHDLAEELLCETIVRSDERPPMLLVRTLHGGAAFRVALVRPGVDACLSCLVAYRAEQHPDWINVPADDLADVFDEGCAAASRPGAGLSSQHAATFAAARGLDVLEDRPLDVNHWLWVERPIADGDDRLLAGLTLHTARFLPRRDCAICGA